jgi:DRTGG domain
VTVVLLTSPHPNAGRTFLAIALGQRLRRAHAQVSYRRLPSTGAIADARFAATSLRLTDRPEDLVLGEPRISVGSVLGADILFVEDNTDADRSAARAVFAAGAIPLLVAGYRPEGLSEEIVVHARDLGIILGWVILNHIPEKGLRQVTRKVIPALREAGLTVLGTIPEDRLLLGMSVGELADALGAEVLCAGEELDRPVEAVMIAAMSDEGAEDYFRRRSRKAVVAGGDRPDVHMPALATDTSCIVLTEGFDPDPTVLKTAEELGVPLLKVKPGTPETLENISTALSQTRFRQTYKVSHAAALVGQHVDEKALNQALGITLAAVRR